MLMRWWLVTALLLAASTAGAVDMNDTQLARYHALTTQLRCLICQNRSIAVSDAPLAADLRQIVAKKIVAGQSDAQIKQYLVDRYGQWVLYDPPFQFSTWLLWLSPFALLLVGLAIVGVLMLRRGRFNQTVAAVASADRERLAALLSETPDTGRQSNTDSSERADD